MRGKRKQEANARRERRRSLPPEERRCIVRREVRTSLVILAAVPLQALAILLFYQPAGIVSGGVTGIGMLIQYVTNGAVQSWVIIVALNLPLLALALWKLHIRFTAYTVFSTLYFSLCMALFENLSLPQVFDFSNPLMPLISILFGAVAVGVLGSLVIRVGASSGGTDILSLLLNRRYSFPMGSISMAINVLVVIALAFFSGVEEAAMSAIALFVCSVAFNNALLGLNRTKTVFIISDNWDKIAPHILNEVHRGVTYIPCKGAYTDKEKTLVYIIARTVELTAIRRIVQEQDPRAIFSIIDTREVVGKGFTAVN